MFAAAEAHEHLALDPRRPIDVFAAIRGAGLELIFRPLRAVSGLYLPAAPGLSAGVLISSHHPLARQRLTAAHEFGHHWLGHEASVDPLTEPDTAAAALAPTEMVAEAFAAWFMMPPELADSALAEMGLERPRSPVEVYELALRMGTSYQATLAQLPNLHLVSGGEARRWAGLPVKAIKEELSRGVPMRSYRNDIHLLGSVEAPRRVGPGDRLLVQAGSTGVPSPLPPGAELRADWRDPSIAGVGIGRVERILVIDLDERTEGTFELRVAAEGGGDARFVLEIAGPEFGRERDPAEADVHRSSAEQLQESAL